MSGVRLAEAGVQSAAAIVFRALCGVLALRVDACGGLVGDWLSVKQAQALLNAPDVSTWLSKGLHLQVFSGLFSRREPLETGSRGRNCPPHNGTSARIHFCNLEFQYPAAFGAGQAAIRESVHRGRIAFGAGYGGIRGIRQGVGRFDSREHLVAGGSLRLEGGAAIAAHMIETAVRRATIEDLARTAHGALQLER